MTHLNIQDVTTLPFKKISYRDLKVRRIKEARTDKSPLIEKQEIKMVGVNMRVDMIVVLNFQGRRMTSFDGVGSSEQRWASRNGQRCMCT
jgi:hypothetical protein